MKIKIDIRENQLIKLLRALNNDYGYNIEITTEKLDLCDLILTTDKDQELLMIERKSINDLASSIKDGRYAEQSLRLNSYNLHNHNIVYLIEGDISNWSNKYSKMKKETLYVTMFCLNYYKGFSVIKTKDLYETAEYILRFTDKMGREKHKQRFYNNDNTMVNSKKYCEVIQKVKKKNITPENIGEIILSQIPGISSTTSMAVIEKYGSLYNLLMALNENPKCLDGLTYETKNKERRRISKTSIRNIVQYLLYQKSNIIKIDV